MKSENPEKADDERHFELVDRYLLGTLSLDEKPELESALESSPELREQFRRLVHAEQVLRSRIEEPRPEKEPAPPSPTAVRPIMWMPLAFGIAIGVAATLALLRIFPENPAERQTPVFDLEGTPILADLSTDYPVAVLPVSAGAKWGDHTPYREGASLYRGHFRAAKGLFVIDFQSGVSVLAKAPLDLELVDPLHAICREGDLRVLVPPQVTDFRLAAPDREVVGEGPEFGISVREAESVLHLVSTGGASLDDERFPTIDQISRLKLDSDASAATHWEARIQQLQGDPELRILYRFRPNSSVSRTLVNEVVGAPAQTHGSVVGPSWSTGPLPGQAALEFDQPGDRVFFADESEYSAISLMTWIRVDRLKPQTSIMNSERWEPGEVHWGLSTQGRALLEQRIPGKNTGGWPQTVNGASETPFFKKGTLGQWIHLTTTYDPSSGEIRHYLDGRLDTQSETKIAGIPIRLGLAELGNWTPADHARATRERFLSGGMSFFAMWGRILSPREIEEIYRDSSGQIREVL